MSKNYLPYLSELSQNNHKGWMDANRDWYQDVRSEFLKDVEFLLKEICAFEPEMASLQPKDCVFRQNRDIRFSNNKDPYKTNLAAYFSIGGKKSNGPGYYLHIQPGASFLAGGIWMPPADVLKKIRQEIDYSGNQLEEILSNKALKKHFSGLEGEQLKTTPKGYEADHPYLRYLKFKSFILSCHISDEDIHSGKFREMAVERFRLLKPFHGFLHQALDDAESGEGIL